MQMEMELIVEDQIHRGEALSGALPDAPFTLPPPQKEVASVARMYRVCARACSHVRACRKVSVVLPFA